MSGIAAIIRLDGGPVHPGEMEAMLASMERRGPDSQRGWRSEQAALGQVLLATTPEATCEAQPWCDRATGCVVVSDSRLDNRPDLLRALDLPATNPDGVGDGELLLAAWQRWGEACAERLLGDFAFAIWDPRRRTLFCARDVMGVRPFYYHYAPDKRFVLASETTAVLTQPVPADLNEGRIADAIVSELEGIDKTSTFFRAIARLPPARALVLRDGQLSITEYWHPLLRAPSRLPRTDGEWVEGVREVLQESVRCRLRGSARVGSMLSGGLDSATVVALADEMVTKCGLGPLATFSAVNSVGDCQETTGVRTMLRARKLDATLVDLQATRMIQDTLRERLELLAEPFDGTMTLVDGLYRSATEHGVRCLMDGMPADNLYTTAGQVQRLLAEGRLVAGYHEALVGHRDCDHVYPAIRAALMVAAHFAPDFVRNARRHYLDRASFRKTLIDGTLIDEAYAHDVDLWGRYMRSRADMDRQMRTRVDSPVRALSTMSVSYITAAVERYGRVAASRGAEPRHPYLDRRVIEFHAWVPIHLRRTVSWRKWVLRTAIEPFVPAETAWVMRRPHLGSRFNICGVKDLPEWRSSRELYALLGGRLDRRKTEWAIERSRNSGHEADPTSLLAVVLTSAWLRNNRARTRREPAVGRTELVMN